LSGLAFQFFRNKRRKDLQSLSDEELADYYRLSRDQEAVGILYQRYTHLLFTVCYKYLGNEADAEDTVMLVFEKLFDLMQRTGIQNFRSWIYTLTKNECLMQLRHRKTGDRVKSENLRKLDSEIMESDSSVHPLPEKEQEQRMQYLEKAIRMLSAEQMKCIALFYLDERSYREVEEITGYTYNEVKSHIQNGKRRLKLIMGKMERYD
jgi:RNA polymerase sigma factor (sigma-70 family)